LKKISKIFSVFLLLVVVLTSCFNPSPAGIAPFVYMAELEDYDYKIIEYYPDEERKQYVNKQISGDHYRNAYYDGQKFYLSMSHTFFIYDSVTKKVKELPGVISNALKKINGEIWVATDNGLRPGRYSSSLCKINEADELECLYDINNQQVDDFYIDFERQVFYAAGPGVPGDNRRGVEDKVVKYSMVTGEEENVRNDGKQIVAARLSNICPGTFITSDADIYRETGEKIGEIRGSKGQQVYHQINDLVAGETAFLDYDNKLLEVYGCDNDQVSHRRTIQLNYEPNTYPGYHSWETTDTGEITLPIEVRNEWTEYIGFQSINLRTGEVQVHLFDEPVYKLHAVARFV